ncbi:outer membrane lipoprotein carrier protein LolA, partial [Candidatus Hydrogenedentota bacterium]
TPSSSKTPRGTSDVRVYVEKDSSLIRRVDYLDNNGKQIMSTKFKNIKVNKSLPKNVFNFQVPPDTEVVKTKKGKVTVKKNSRR